MFDLAALREAVAARSRVARIVIASVDGSAPREAGAAMLVWAGGSAGTIGGGALEWEATGRALGLLASGERSRFDRVPLGPALGQCCGGSVGVLTEVYEAATLPEGDVVARAVDGRAMPLAVKRLLNRARAQGMAPATALVQGWLIEPVARAERQLWVWGAGHVGRALVAVLAPLPGVAITWVDLAADRFPPEVPAGVTVLPAADPVRLVMHAPRGAEHLVLTFSHALDLALCHRLLGHGFARLGLIGSGTKWARFRSRLAALGHSEAQIARIDCPIGEPALGKHPQAIAVGVAAAFLRRPTRSASRRENAG
jgi:xanthine dehydrogenase accessory factor